MRRAEVKSLKKMAFLVQYRWLRRLLVCVFVLLIQDSTLCTYPWLRWSLFLVPSQTPPTLQVVNALVGLEVDPLQGREVAASSPIGFVAMKLRSTSGKQNSKKGDKGEQQDIPQYSKLLSDFTEREEQQELEYSNEEQSASIAVEDGDEDAAILRRELSNQPKQQQQQQQQHQQQQQQQHMVLQDTSVGTTSSSVRLSDLPPLAFPRPSPDLVRLTEVLGKFRSSSDRESVRKVFPFGVPIEVRSIATGAKYEFILRSVLGSGGQGVVLLAQDVGSSKAEFALKVFWIKPRRQRGFARDVERLKRRVRLEVAIAKSAPADIPLSVWSHLSHVVMPLDVVEPTTNFTPPPDDRTRYWPQWVVFERFAGDLAMLRGLPFASASAKLSATKQMLLAVVRMHDMGMVHSDVKTQNFFVKSDGRIFLGDYSLAHPAGQLTACTEGTASYLPPENLKCMQAKERNIRVTAVKDSWALGTVLFRVWCFGSRPYNVDDLLFDEVLEKLAGVRIEDLDLSHCSPETPVAILHMLRLLLDPNPELRPKPRDIYERHPAFTMKRKDLLADTLGGLILTVNTKGLRPG